MLGRTRRTPLVDLVVLLALLLGQRAVLGLDHGTFTSDEGSYALQAVAVADGHWDVEDPFVADSPDGALSSYVNSTIDTDGRVYPYSQRPAWPVVLGAAYDIGGEGALYLVPLLFALLVPLVAWRLASLLVGPGSARVAFWAAAVSPAVVVNSHVLWAHSASALVGGLAVLGAVEARRRLRVWPVAVLLAAVFVGVLLRAEGLLLAGALAAALGAGAVLDQRSRPDGAGPLRRDLGLAIGVGAVGIAGFLSSSAWRDAITGTPDELAARGSGGSRLRDAASGAVHDLIGSSARSGRTGLIALTVCVACAVLLGLRARRGLPDAAVFGVVALAALGVAWAISPDAPVTGLGGAWPIGIAGFIALRLEDRTQERLLLVCAGGFAAAVLVTNYAEGGGLEWGGRFLSPITVIGAIGAACLWRSAAAAAPNAVALGRTGGVPLLRAAGVLACVVIAGFATTAMRETRDGGAEAETVIAEIGAPAGLTTNEFLPNIVWRTRPTTDWIVVGSEAPGRPVSQAVDALRAAGIEWFVSVGVPVADLEDAGVAIESVDGQVVVGRTASAP